MNRKQAISKVRRLFRKIDTDSSYGYNDGVVLVQDGKETDNVYEQWARFEPDCKSVTEWIMGIFLFNGDEMDIDFRIRRDDGKK